MCLDKHGRSADDDTCHAYPALMLQLWVEALLSASSLAVAEQQCVTAAIDRHLSQWSHDIANWRLEEGGPPPLYQLVFTDGQYFTYTGAAEFIDLHTGKRVKPQRPPLESISYNLTELFLRRYAEAAR